MNQFDHCWVKNEVQYQQTQSLREFEMDEMVPPQEGAESLPWAYYSHNLQKSKFPTVCQNVDENQHKLCQSQALQKVEKDLKVVYNVSKYLEVQYHI